MTIDKLRDQLKQLAPPLFARLRDRGFDPTQLETWAASLGGDHAARNRLSGTVTEVDPKIIQQVPEPGSVAHQRLSNIGNAALARGELAVCVLAGGMATRMGGVVKALVDALPGITFLDMRLAEVDGVTAEHGAPLPLWLMTSEATNERIRDALNERLDGKNIATFEQFVSLRLTPEGELFYDEQEPSVYATGHGDLPDALRSSGLLQQFIERGGRYVWIENLDNLGARVDPAILGGHIESGARLTVELVDKRPGDKGGGPVLHDGRPIVAEHFRLPLDFDAERVLVFNTNTFLVDARALQNLAMNWTYVEVHKDVEGRTAIQFERIVNEMTMAIEPRFLRVSREGTTSRFLPCKDFEDLKAIRDVVEELAKERGLR
jgi:UTP--glucose-1-phosphate uridylyltransferase